MLQLCGQAIDRVLTHEYTLRPALPVAVKRRERGSALPAQAFFETRTRELVRCTADLLSLALTRGRRGKH